MSDGPLSVLVKSLESLGIPSLSSLIACLAGAEEYKDFVSLVREFLPERERSILYRQTPQFQVAAFAQYFEDRYFPLDDPFKVGDVESYLDLTQGIPVILQGLSYDDYELIASDWREGYQLMTYLVESPYEEDRVALAEALSQYLPRELVEQIPPHANGLSPEELHRLLDGTKFQPLADWASMVWHDTGNFFLDTDYEEMWNQGRPPWNKETVQRLTQEWQQAERIGEEIYSLATWLEEDPPAHFAELLSFIQER
jgi:hypothetical protein